MSDFQVTRAYPELSVDSLSSADPLPHIFRDRSIPMWATALSIFFSMGAGICLFAIAVFAIFFFDLVASDGNELLAGLLTLGALVPIIGLLIFDVGHAKALVGYRYLRDRNTVFGKAILGGMAGLTFFLLNPLLGAPFIGGAFLSWLLCNKATRIAPPEPLWEFLPAEAVSFLSGRDRRALELANGISQQNVLLDGFQRSIGYFSLISAMAVSCWLVTSDILNPAAITTITLITYWSVDAFAEFFKRISLADPEKSGQAVQVTELHSTDLDDAQTDISEGLHIHDLSVHTKEQIPLLSGISFHAAPGSIIGVQGDSLSGKTTLFQAITAPRDLRGLTVQGSVQSDGVNLWDTSAKERVINAVHIPPQPLLVPGSGTENLTCFSDAYDQARAKRILKSLVLTSDVTDKICNAPEVQTLSSTEQKSLAFARAFALRPRVMLFDRPEDGADEKLLNALGERVRAEARLGTITLFVTENRGLLNICDTLLMMQKGTLIEYASAALIRERKTTGWQRFVAERELESEEPLDAWISSQFRRDGDEKNRRAVCLIANDLLLIACKEISADAAFPKTVTFEFKNFEGYCLLRMTNINDSISECSLEKAKDVSEESSLEKQLPPLARLVKKSIEMNILNANDVSWLQVSVKTVDPRLKTNNKVAKNASQQS